MTPVIVQQIITKHTIVNDKNNKKSLTNMSKQQKTIGDQLTKNQGNLDRMGQKLSKLGKGTGETKKLQKSFDDLSKSTKDLQKEYDSLNTQQEQLTKSTTASTASTYAYAAALAAVTKITYDAFMAGTQYVENLNIIRTLFGENSEAVIEWAGNTRNSFGLATSSALGYVSKLKAFSTALGLSDDQSNFMSIQGAQLAADMASFYNVSFDKAFGAIQSGLAGITRTLRFNFGIDLGEETLKEKYGSEYGSTQAERVMQRFETLLEQTQFVMGDFAKTKQSPGSQIRLLSENMKEMTLILGQAITPTLTLIFGGINKVLDVLIAMGDTLVIIAGLVAIGSIINAMKGGGGLLGALTGGRGFGIKGILSGVMKSIAIGALLGLPFKGLLEDVSTNDGEMGDYPDIIPPELAGSSGTQSSNSTETNFNFNGPTDEGTVLFAKEQEAKNRFFGN